MKRRDFLYSLAGAAALGSVSCRPGSASPVDTPEKRRAYLSKMLKSLCTDIGPKPVGSDGYQKAAVLIGREMELALPKVRFDCFKFKRWKETGTAGFFLKDRELETYCGFGSPATPPEGISGLLKKDKAVNPSYTLVHAKTGAALANVSVSAYGRAVPSFYNGEKQKGLPAFNIGRQDVPALDEAVKKKTTVRVKAQAEFIPESTACNVAGTLEGKQKDEILFLAHADTLYNTEGANDNTASLIAMLMLAHAVSGSRPQKAVTFVATAGEEYGLLGAEQYARTRESEGTLKNIRFCVNFDSLTYGPNFQVYSRDGALKSMIGDIHRKLQIKAAPKYFDLKDDNLDEAPFLRAGARTLYVNSRGYDEETLHLWHRPEDKPETVHPELIENSFLVFNELIARLQKI